MSEMQPSPKDYPAILAFEKYRASDEFRNSFKWACDAEHRIGLMWTAFYEGFQAALSASGTKSDGGDDCACGKFGDGLTCPGPDGVPLCVAPGPSDPITSQPDEVEAIARLLTAAKLLQQHAVGCATNHHGHDCELNGLPGWLADTKNNIDAAEDAILAMLAERREFTCAARKQSLPEPADCDWPVCGCDPYADKVIAALEESGALKDQSQHPAPIAGLEPGCPFCGRDPFHRIDNGIGMEAVAVTCCDLGDLFFRGARAAPSEVTLSWEEFMEIGHKIAVLRMSAAQLEAHAAEQVQAERQGDNTIQRDKIYRAAERSNTRFGQWIPERWVNIFVEEMSK